MFVNKVKMSSQSNKNKVKDIIMSKFYFYNLEISNTKFKILFLERRNGTLNSVLKKLNLVSR